MITNYRGVGTKKVLAVVVRDDEGWRVYIAPVAGKDHQGEAPEVARSGGKVTAAVARAIFPREEGPYVE